MIFCFVIKFPKGIFDIHISLFQVEINFPLTSVVSFKISLCTCFLKRLFVLQIQEGVNTLGSAGSNHSGESGATEVVSSCLKPIQGRESTQAPWLRGFGSELEPASGSSCGSAHVACPPPWSCFLSCCGCFVARHRDKGECSVIRDLGRGGPRP